MKKRFAVLLVVLLAGAGFAQRAGPFNLTAQNQCATITVSSQSAATVGIVVSGTWSATLTPQVIIAGQAAANSAVYPYGSTTSQSTIAANGAFNSPIAAADKFQVCATAYTSGTAVVYLNVSTGSAKTGGGGGGTNNPGGSAGQIQTNAGSSFGGFTASGDATINTTTGVVTVQGLHFGASGFTFGTAPTSGQCLYAITSSTIGGTACGSGGANTALSNLSAVSINTSLLAQTGVDLGATTTPFRNLYLFGAGTYGTNYFEITGTPTSTRVYTLPDTANDTFAMLAATQTLTNKTISGGTFSGTIAGSPTFSGTPVFSNTLALNTSGNAGTATALASYTGYSIYGSGASSGSWITPTANGQCLMSGASSYATTIPSFQACPSGGGGLSGMTALGFPIPNSATTINSSTTPGTNQGTYLPVRVNPTNGVAATPTEQQVGIGGRALTGATTTDTVLYSDVNQVIDHDQGASAGVTETIPTPATLNNTSFGFNYWNHSAQTDTLKATTNTIQLGQAAAVAGATGVTIGPGQIASVKQDPNLSTQWLVNIVDQAGYINGTAFSGSNGNLVKFGASNVPTDSGIAAANVVTAASAAAAAKQLCVASGTSKTCSYVDLPEHLIIPAANCNNATAGAGWSIPASNAPTVACRAGTNNLGGALQWANNNTTTNAQFTIQLPFDWDTATQPYINIIYGSGANTSGTVKWTFSSACTKSDGSITDDPAFVAETTTTGKTMAVANRTWSENVQFANVTSGNNCIAGSQMIVKVTSGNGTATSTVNVYQVTMTIPRLTTVQAN